MSFRIAPASGANMPEADCLLDEELLTRVVGMQFGLLSPQEIERMAPKVITDNVAHAKNLPKLNGPNDPALGPADRRVRCRTCRDKWYGCMGHPGVIRLPLQVYHAGHVDTTYKLLQAVCHACCRPKCSDAEAAATTIQSGMPRFAFTFGKCKGRIKCPHCGCPQPKYAKAGVSITRSWKPAQLDALRAISPALAADAVRKFTPTDALDIFANMSDADVRAFGMHPTLAHPAWLILQNVAVLPPNARPAIMAAEGSKRRGQDDITSQTQQILKACKAVRKHVLALFDPPCYERLTNKRKHKESATAARAAEAAASKSGASAKPAETALDESRTAALNERLTAIEFCVGGSTPSQLTEAEALATRWALPDDVITLSAAQASQLWVSLPVLCEKLQTAVAIMFDNSGRYAPQARQRTGGAKKGLTDRWVGKTGRMRGNLVAKRVDMSARTVIKPDACLDVDQLGIPTAFAVVLTKQEDVNARNVQRLTEAVRRGPGVLGGAARVLLASGTMLQLQYVDAAARARLVLQPGDLVERHLRDDDRLVFNRQPSLHRLSMMTHRIKLIDGLAISVPLAVVGPYNADFDGDEMNLHALQAALADAESAELMAVSRNVMNPQNNEPCLGLVQDVRVGAMLLTRRSTTLSRDQMHQCVGAIAYPLAGKPVLPPPGAAPGPDGAPRWTGKQLVSLILPSIFMERWTRGADPAVTRADDPEERYVHIHAGELRAGVLCKATLSSATGGIVHRICTDFGQEAAVRFLSDFQRIIYTWLPSHGLSMGLKDCVVAASTRAQIDAGADALDALVAQLTEEAAGISRVPPATAARLEAYILTILTSSLDRASKLVLGEAAERDGRSGFMDMVAAGSKGNSNNIAQVMACLGQQVVDGRRIGPAAPGGRTLPCFPPGAFSAAARGFVSSSYLSGMLPHEYFYHMQGGRAGLVATAVKTAETGYGYRSMEKAQENNVTQWDASVRNGQGYVIECVVGGDCMDPTRLERVDMSGALRADDAAVAAAMAADPVAAARVRTLRDNLRAALLTPLYTDLTTTLLLPLNVRAERERCAHDRPALSCAPTAAVWLSEVDALVDALRARLVSADVMVALELAVRWECAPALLTAARLDVASFRATLAREIYTRTLDALAQPGDAVGIVAAQSIGEPSTQFTLDAFHQAGLVQRRMTVGVPRLKELTNASKHITTPSMVLPLRGGISQVEAERLAATLQFTCLDAVLTSSYVQLDPPGDGISLPYTNMAKDAALMEAASALFGSELASGENLSPWVLRLVLNKPALAVHNFTPEAVALELARQVADTPLQFVASQPNASAWVVRVRVLDDPSETACRRLHARVREQVLLGGISGVRDARLVASSRTSFGRDGELIVAPAFCVDTDGSALRNVATRDWVDWEHTVTNDVQEVAAVLGIVAARATLFAELDRVISYDGGYVDARHLVGLVCTMTHRGELMAATRHGINRVDFSVLQKASYEEPVDMILQAALTAERDDLNGVCQAVIVGQKVPVGTGTVSVQRDVDVDVDMDAMQPPVFGNARTGFTSRACVAQDNVVGKKRRRQPDTDDSVDAAIISSVREGFKAPEAAAAAWATLPAAGSSAAARQVTRLPQAFRRGLAGRLITTNKHGVFDATMPVARIVDAAVTAQSAQPAHAPVASAATPPSAAVNTHGRTRAFRPSSPV
jgi:DNA-directed RNA polymerase beta' subunit